MDFTLPVASDPGSVSAKHLAIAEHLVKSYPALDRVGTAALAADMAALPCLDAPEDATLFSEGDACKGLPLLLLGEVRVARATASGREIELYRVRPGEFCIASAACLFGGQRLSAHGATTCPSRLLIVPRETFLRWTDHRDVRAQFVAAVATRVGELMSLIDAVISQRLDSRLAHTLLGHGAVLHTTHQRLADDLGTSREMVSRLLGRFESEGLVALGRERIEILAPEALRAIVDGTYPRSQTESVTPS